VLRLRYITAEDVTMIATRIGDINYGKYWPRLLEEAVYYIIPDVGRKLGGATANLY